MCHFQFPHQPNATKETQGQGPCLCLRCIVNVRHRLRKRPWQGRPDAWFILGYEIQTQAWAENLVCTCHCWPSPQEARRHRIRMIVVTACLWCHRCSIGTGTALCESRTHMYICHIYMHCDTAHALLAISFHIYSLRVYLLYAHTHMPMPSCSVYRRCGGACMYI